MQRVAQVANSGRVALNLEAAADQRDHDTPAEHNATGTVPVGLTPEKLRAW